MCKPHYPVRAGMQLVSTTGQVAVFRSARQTPDGASLSMGDRPNSAPVTVGASPLWPEAVPPPERRPASPPRQSASGTRRAGDGTRWPVTPVTWCGTSRRRALRTIWYYCGLPASPASWTAANLVLAVGVPSQAPGHVVDHRPVDDRRGRVVGEGSAHARGRGGTSNSYWATIIV
jgi:hypothetical protein